jgi:hypothetical protein
MGESINACRILVGPLEIPGREDNIKIYLKEIGWECVEWLYLAQDRNK